MDISLKIIIFALIAATVLSQDSIRQFTSTIRLDPSSRLWGKDLFLSTTTNCFDNNLSLGTENDGISQTNFLFKQVKDNHYTIKISTGRTCLKNFFSAQNDCNGKNAPDLFWDQTEAGNVNQHFRLVPVEGKLRTFTIESVGRLSCYSRFISAPFQGYNVDFYDGDDLSGRQQWILDGFPNIYKSIELTEMFIDFNNRKVLSTITLKGNMRQLVNQSPTETSEIEYESCTESTVTQEWESEQTDAFKTSFEAGVSVSVTAGFDIGVASASVTAKADAKMGRTSEKKTSINEGKSSAKTESICINSVCKAPPNKKVECYTKIDQVTYEIPWTATEVRRKFDGGIELKNVAGNLKMPDTSSVYQIVQESEITDVPSFLKEYDLEKITFSKSNTDGGIAKILKRISKKN